jgi:colicin import membrane protein
MKTIKKITLLAAFAFAALQAGAQTKSGSEPAATREIHNSYDRVHSENGKQVEEMEIWTHDRLYKAKLVNDQLTALSIDGKDIPESDWNKYSDDIAAIKEQIKQNRIQAKKNEEQARLNEIQAKKNQEQEKLNEIQAKKNEEQAARNEEQGKMNRIQEEKNAEQAIRNKEQDKRNEEQAQKNAEQAKLNQTQQEKDREQVDRNKEQVARNEEQAKRNEIQAKKNQEQARLNEIQGKKNEEQARLNEEFIKSVTMDLVADKIIPDADSLKELTFNDNEMIVNGVKQSAEIYQKYIHKYSGFVKGNFNFSRDGIIRGN